MRFLIRLLGALWFATLVVSVGFAWYEVHEERSRLVEDLQRRASLTADAVREAAERLGPRPSRAGYERLLMRFSRPDRAVAIYDAFGSPIDATPEVRRGLGLISPLVSDAIRRNATTRGLLPVSGRTRFVHVVPLAGLVCGIIAWVMGNTDLAEMRAGRMDREGESQTNAGRICGIITVVLHIIAVIGLIGFFTCLCAGAGAAGRH